MSIENPTPTYLTNDRYYQRPDGTWWYKKKTQDHSCTSYNCDECGSIFYSPATNIKYKQQRSRSGKLFCCRTCSNRSTAKLFPAKKGHQSHMWKGGKRKTGNGYIRLFAPDHPNKTIDDYVLEHRLVMEAHLGRILLSKEEVHHKNGVRNDNRLDNLELWTSSHPAGQRVSDQIAWAKEILDTYKDVDL